MLVRILIPLCWTLWSILLLVLLYGLVRVSTERASSPEAGRGLGIFAILFLMALLAVAAVLLMMATRKQSPAGLITMTVLLAYPLVSIVAHPAIQAYKRRSFANAEARVGDFSDPTLNSMARAITSNDTVMQLVCVDAATKLEARPRRARSPNAVAPPLRSDTRLD